MSEKERLVRARLGILALAAELGNVARACKLAGLSRSQFYAMKKAYETYGKDALAPRERRKPEMPNRTPREIEERILVNTYQYPTFSYIRLAIEMKAKGVNVSPTMVRYVWQRHSLSTQSARRTWVKLLDDGSRLQAAKNMSSEALGKPLHGESNTGIASVVDWTCWSERMRESFTK
jgi:transposase-like protein